MADGRHLEYFYVTMFCFGEKLSDINEILLKQMRTVMTIR